MGPNLAATLHEYGEQLTTKLIRIGDEAVVREPDRRLIVRLITRGLEMRARAGHRSSGRN